MKKQIASCLLLAYLLGCHEGYIALWTDSSAKPARVYPYAVSSLPPADQQALKEGISVKDNLELSRLIEDFLS